MIPVIVISLARSRERRSRVADHLASLQIPFTFFDAFDAQTMTPGDFAALDVRPTSYRHGMGFLPAEIACLASFRAAFQSIARGSDDFVCLLEDDAILSPRVHPFLNEETLRQLPAFDIMRLQHANAVAGLPLASVGDIEVFAPFRSHSCAYAQICTRKGAAKIAAGLVPMRMTVDNAIYSHAYVPWLRVVEVCPALAAPIVDALSTIDPKGLRAHWEDLERQHPSRRSWLFQRRVALRRWMWFCLNWGHMRRRWLKEYPATTWPLPGQPLGAVETSRQI